METAQRYAHTLKGVAGNIAATDVYEAAATVEAAIKQDNLKDIDALLDKLSDPLEFVINSINSIDNDK